MNTGRNKHSLYAAIYFIKLGLLSVDVSVPSIVVSLRHLDKRGIVGFNMRRHLIVLNNNIADICMNRRKVVLLVNAGDIATIKQIIKCRVYIYI